VTYTQNFDAENRLISVNISGQSQPTLFVYDGDGNSSTSPRKAAAPLRAGLVKQI
jgi:hypothetical protein